MLLRSRRFGKVSSPAAYDPSAIQCDACGVVVRLVLDVVLSAVLRRNLASVEGWLRLLRQNSFWISGSGWAVGDTAVVFLVPIFINLT